ncbi:RRP8 [[Candida] subhashii]|uniref:Ribosomal RNA-processing protein 8 n=1 Tax=[Candida] subhashii TaxID=561895 RepID=A0A8J5QRV3_9ASCO|nr:RRP8 [[Candida] subhashii]KAG7665288.1 RRP8 [[Candida] subhashii]
MALFQVKEDIQQEIQQETQEEKLRNKEHKPESKKPKKEKKEKKSKPAHPEPEPQSAPAPAPPAPAAPIATTTNWCGEVVFYYRFERPRAKSTFNEQLYTTTSESALKLIQDQPSLFDEYHQGFRSQVQSWPENPVDVFVDQIKTRASTRPVNAPGGLPGLQANKKVVIADMGCGEAQLALDVGKFVKEYAKKNKGRKPIRNGGARNLEIEVHSFDLKKYNDRITVADIKNVPLADGSCTIVIFCLALMGTNFLDFIEEAYRILAPRGELWIAEIKSRFSESSGGSGGENKNKNSENVGQEFVDALKLCGFFHKNTDNSNKMFTRFEFFKPPLLY